MVRLIGVDLPNNKKIVYALTAIHGIGLTSAKNIVQLANIDFETRTSDLTTEQTFCIVLFYQTRVIPIFVGRTICATCLIK